MQDKMDKNMRVKKKWFCCCGVAKEGVCAMDAEARARAADDYKVCDLHGHPGCYCDRATWIWKSQWKVIPRPPRRRSEG